MLRNCVDASEILGEAGYDVGVLSMHTLKPFDGDVIARDSARTGALFTVEEHSVIGGLGGAAAE